MAITAAVRTGMDELVARHDLNEDARTGLLALLQMVACDEHAPTTVREPQAALGQHVADSLVALELEPVRTATSVADIGSGSGFPGLPLALAKPDASVVLLESNSRKCVFLTRAIASAGADNAAVVHARAESWTDGLGRFQLITARALGPLAVAAEYAAPLLELGGSLVVWRGRREQQAEAEAERAAGELGLEVQAPISVHPFRGAQHRHLHVMVKATETPAQFPRRPGIASKRPLGRV